MSVKKIVYITPGESEKGELTSAAESQLRSVAQNVLEWEIGNTPMVFRETNKSSLNSSSNLLYISNTFRKAINNASEAHYRNLISNPENIPSIVDSTRWWNAVIVFVVQDELKNVLEALQENWYNTVDKEAINHPYNVYAVSVDTEKKQSRFFVAKWWE